MAALDGRVAIVTGAGQGLGREHALLFAAEGARVVVNDVDASLVQKVAGEITASGGEAIANTDSVSDWGAAEGLIEAAVQGFGDLHVLVNNAGILRDRMLVNMTEQEFDSVVNVNPRERSRSATSPLAIGVRSRRPVTTWTGPSSTPHPVRGCSPVSARRTTRQPKPESQR